MNMQQMRRAAQREAAHRLRGSSPDEINDLADEILDEWMVDVMRDRADQPIPEDSPCIQSCDDWGTGEGRYHGRM